MTTVFQNLLRLALKHSVWAILVNVPNVTIIYLLPHVQGLAGTWPIQVGISFDSCSSLSLQVCSSYVYPGALATGEAVLGEVLPLVMMAVTGQMETCEVS